MRLLLWVILLFVGAVAGVKADYARFGIFGGLFGLPVGVAAGFLIFCGIALLLNRLLRPKKTIPNKPHNEDPN